MKYKNKIKNKQERGAITLFVLLACLFFVFILTGTYLSNLNRLQVQEQEVKQIQENYAKDIERVDEIYQNMSKANVITELTQTIKNPTEDGWTKDGVTLTAKAEIKKENEQNTKKLDEYVISKEENPNNIPNSDWTKTTSTEKEKIEVSTPEDDPITENGTYYFHVKDSDGKIYTDKIQVGKVDIAKPTPGTLVDDNGQEFSKTNPTIVDKDTYIEKVDGSDDESGHKETTYTVVKDSKIYQKIAENGELITYQDLSNPKSLTLTETGSYEITVTTKDKVGNDASNVYVIKIVVVGVELTQTMKNPTEDGWTKDGVILTAKAEIDQGKDNTRQFEKYVITKEEKASNVISSEWTTVTEAQKEKIEVSTPDTEPIKENGKYYFHAVDNDGKTYTAEVEVGNIDTINPTPGTLVDDQGQEFDKTNPTVTDQDIYIEKVDGSDNESGHKQTTYTILKDSTVYTETNASGEVTTYQNINEPKSLTLTEVGRYEITVTTKDKAGNEASNNYVIVISKEAPELILKHNDSSGINYEQGTWTKDDLYGEVNTDTTATGNVVEKYQYSEDGTTWKDISGEIIPTSIDYITAFPMSEDKPEWISGPTNNGTYYFGVQADGTLKSNNNGKNNTTANSYFEIDLTDYPEANLEITLNTTISSQTNNDYGYATITESSTPPRYNTTEGRFIYVSGSTKTSDYTTTITGGKKYYLHIGYRKNSSTSLYQDMFMINSIKLYSPLLGKDINFYNYEKNNNKVIFKLKEDIEKEIYIRAVYENGKTSKYGDKTSIKIDKKAPLIDSIDTIIVSRENAKVEVKVTEKESGLRGYYISTEITEPREIDSWNEQKSDEFTIEGLNTNTTYYLYTIDNAGNISEKKEISIGTANYLIDDKITTQTINEAINVATDGSVIKLLGDYTDMTTATFSKSVTFDVQSYILTRSETITINSGKTIEIIGTGKITTEANNTSTVTNNGTLIVSDNITIENKSTSSSYAPIRNNSSSATINIKDNVQIIGYYRGIYNYSGSLNLNGGKIEATYSNSSAYGIYNYQSSAKTYINIGEVKGYYGIYNSNNSSLVEVLGGKVIGTGAYGIFANGTTNIYGGRIEGKTYGIYSNTTSKVTIGRNDDKLSTTIPAIYGESYGIYMDTETYSFNFYNGVLISNTEITTYKGKINPRTGYMPYTYFNYEEEQKYCTILAQTVEKITMEASPTEFTNKDVTVKITYPYNDYIRQYSEDGIEWKNVEENVQMIVITENKIVYARTINESGIVIDENQIAINNIDKEKPIVTISPSKTTYIVTGEENTVDILVNLNATDTGVSGLDKMQYAWTKEGETVTYIDFDNTVEINKTKLKVGKYNLYINVTDKAGNRADIVQMRYTVKYEEPVCQIGSTQYITVQSAVDACSKEAGETQTTIEMLKSTDEEFYTYEGQNIVLDLKGYTIGSSSLEKPLCINDAKLQLIDSSTEKIGKLESLNGTTILNNGTLTLGDNNTAIEYDTPTIYGYKIGISNNDIFNFYDGKIQGITPIQGNTTDTPEEYGPVSTGFENGITTIQLGIVVGYEARIEWIYYTKLQDAIYATKVYKNDYRDTVTIVKDIQLKEPIEINANKNIILDLNNFILTISSGQDRLINNYGNLEITDKSADNLGNLSIISTGTNYGIYNKNSGIVSITGGTLNVNSDNSYGIYNETIGTVKISGGQIICDSSSFGCGIYNKTTGEVNVKGGIISCMDSNNAGSNNYGIYNVSDGKIEMTGGTISASVGNNNGIRSYGIYNNGNLEVIDGIISATTSYTQGNSKSYGIYNTNNGTTKIIGGTTDGNSCRNGYGIYNCGKVEVIGGIISGSLNGSTPYNDNGIYGIYNEGIVELTGGNININKGNYASYGIYNNGKVKLLEGEVNNESSGYGIYNCKQAEIIGGTVSAYNGIYNEDSATIIIGDKEKEISHEKPIIKGIKVPNNTKPIGLINTLGAVEFYNGIIQGSTALSGSITQLRENCKIESSITENLETIYLVEITNREYVVQIEGVRYYNLQEAIDSLGNIEKTIEVLRNFELEQSTVFNKKVILDLKGYEIVNNYYRMENTNELTIIDTSAESQGKLIANDTRINLLNRENGKINIEKGIINTNNVSSSYGIYNFGNIEMTDGIIDGDGYGIYNIGNGSIKITGGEINVTTGIDNENSGNIELSSVKIVSSYQGIYNKSNGNVKIIGATIINETEFMGYGIRNEGMGNIEILGDTVINNNAEYYSYGIYNGNNGNIQMSNGTINCHGGYYCYGIYNGKQGIITLGIKGDGLVSQEQPAIKATSTSSFSTYGIYNTSGKFYFYDGIIEGKDKAVYDTITEKEDDTEFKYNEDETILMLTTEKIPVAQIGETTYTDLQVAIDSVGANQTTIILLRNIVYTLNDVVIKIPSTKDIILDLKGYTITSSIPEQTLQNEGKLEIIDTSEENTGTIMTNEEKTITNKTNSTLIISGGTIENRNRMAIYNEGMLVVQGGKINVNGQDSYCAIYDAGTASINITGGTIKNRKSGGGNYLDYHESSGIYHESSGTVKMSGGIIDSYNTRDSAYSGAKHAISCGICNVNNGTIDITGGTIKSSSSFYIDSCGIYNKSSGVVSMRGGSIECDPSWRGSSYGIYNVSNGSVYAGDKNNNDSPENKISIRARESDNSEQGYGIYNPEGKLYLYDGKIQGTTKAIYNNISEIKFLAELQITTENISNYEYETLTLLQKTTNAVVVNGTEYDSIQKAVEACGTTESTITVLRDLDPGILVIIGENQNINLDLNGHTVKNYIELQNKGLLRIKDSSTEQLGKMTGLSGIVVLNAKTMEVQGGSISDSGYGIKNTGILTINGGNLTNNTYGIYNDSNGIINFESGNINSNTYGIYNYTGTTNISEVGISNNTYGVYNAGGTTTVKEGAEIQSNTGIYVANGRLNIGETGTMNSSSPVITGETYGLSVASTGTVYMYDGQIKGRTGATQGFITYVESGYIVANKIEDEYFIDYLALAGTISTVAQVNGVDFSNLQSAINSIVGEETQTIKLTNGIISDMTFTISEGQNIILDMNEKTISSDLDITINNSGNLTIIDSTSSGVGKISSTVGVAIKNTGTLTLGKDDGTVSQDVITIEGTTYGIENTGTVNFYDGTINGGSAVRGTITNIPSGYSIQTTSVNSKERYYLSAS